MPYFNGQFLQTPTTASRVDDSALAPSSPAIGFNMVALGQSEGGVPASVLTFGDPDTATKVLRRGDLMIAVKSAFSPSNDTGAPGSVRALRVNPGTQATLALNDSGNPAAASVNLTSVGYGFWTNRIRAKVEAGSVTGFRLTVSLDGVPTSADNIGSGVMTLSYTGPGQATYTVNESTFSVTLNGTTTSLDLRGYSEMQILADALNQLVGLVAVVQSPFTRHPTLKSLDGVAGGALGAAPVMVRADALAVLNWFKAAAGTLVTATRPSLAAVRAPAYLPWTNLAGATGAQATYQDWANAFTALQAQDVQWLSILSSDPAVWAMAEAHCSFMSSRGRERRMFTGGGVGVTDAQAIANARVCNCDLVAYVHGGYYGYDETGSLVLFPAYMTANLICAGFAALGPGKAMTNRGLNVQGMEFVTAVPVQSDQLLSSGVICIDSADRGFLVLQSRSTWLNNLNYNRVEVSVGAGYDFLCRSLRKALDPFRGPNVSPARLALVRSVAETLLTTLAEPEATGGLGLLVGDDKNPAFRGLVATGAGDVITLKLQAAVGIPGNYIFINVAAVPYAGSFAG